MYLLLYVILRSLEANYGPHKITSNFIALPVFLHYAVIFFLSLFCSDSPTLSSLCLLKTLKLLNPFLKKITHICFSYDSYSFFGCVHFSEMFLNYYLTFLQGNNLQRNIEHLSVCFYQNDILLFNLSGLGHFMNCPLCRDITQ